jgi:hypothetical protein
MDPQKARAIDPILASQPALDQPRGNARGVGTAADIYREVEEAKAYTRRNLTNLSMDDRLKAMADAEQRAEMERGPDGGFHG